MSNKSESPTVALSVGPGERISIAVIEDHREFRDYLTALLTGTEGFDCTGGFRSIEEAFRK